jgi:hypothetical protein
MYHRHGHRCRTPHFVAKIFCQYFLDIQDRTSYTSPPRKEVLIKQKLYGLLDL